MRSGKWLLVLSLFALLAAVGFADSASANWGCFNCEVDYTECWFWLGPCDQVCVQVGDGEQGSATFCTQWDAWVSKVCNMNDDACFHTEVNGNDGPPGCPEGSYSADC